MDNSDTVNNVHKKKAKQNKTEQKRKQIRNKIKTGDIKMCTTNPIKAMHFVMMIV